MNWSAYSRYVGDVFGGPLAMEGLAAFFLESTFLGLWVFGWDRLSPRVHLFCIWMVALGSWLSAAFIMAANSWMQHPVGYAPGAAGEPPRLNDIGARVHEPGLPLGLLPRAAGRAGHRDAGAAGGLGVASAARGRGRRVPPQRRAVDHHPGAAEHRAGAGRQPARRDRDALSADEDRRRRGAVGHVPAVLVLGVPDRRRQERRGPAEGDRDPAPAVDPGHADAGTGRSSGSTSSRRSTSSSTGPGTTSRTCSCSTGRCG